MATSTISIAQPRIDALAEEDVARRALCERDALLHRVHAVLRREADRAEMPDVEPSGRRACDSGGRAPPVVTVTAGIPRLTNGACS